MIEISIEGDRVAFEVEGWDQLWSLRSRLEIPLAHISGARVDTQPAMGWFQGLKLAKNDRHRSEPRTLSETNYRSERP